jgi:thymidylate synthase
MSELQYLNAMRQVLAVGERKDDRTGVGTISMFGGVVIRFDLRDGFPLLTTKKVHWKSVWEELRWFLNGSNDVTQLEARGVRIWTPWKREDGTIGVGTYGEGWRAFPSIAASGEPIVVDQIHGVVEQLRNNPDSRRILVNAWNPGRIEGAALPPCHYCFQFYSVRSEEAAGGRYLDLSYSMRSNDLFLGAPFNIASYAALLVLVAHACDMQPRFLIHNVPGDAHIYDNHIDAVEEQLSRSILTPPMIAIKVGLDMCKDGRWLHDLPDDALEIMDYYPHPVIKAPIAV